MSSMATTFGQMLKTFRLRAGFGLRRFADLVDLKPSNLSAIEHGERRPPADPDKLRALAEAVGLAEGSEEWTQFFDAAAREGELPADVRHMAGRHLVPALLRTIDNKQLSDDDLRRLIDEIQSSRGDNNS
jgi:transcriptional regulator with XRE-family HTH domain